MCFKYSVAAALNHEKIFKDKKITKVIPFHNSIQMERNKFSCRVKRLKKS